jgi:radical SAM superfamily enzyme YgiQ (UPF0313 family)
MKNKLANKIVMNYMPPALTLVPSITFSILKNFIEKNGYTSRIIYWNRLIYELLISKFRDFEFSAQTDTDIRFLTPFLFELSDKFKDRSAQGRILSCMRAASPQYETIRKSYSELIKSINESISHLIDAELEKIEADSVLLIGFSSKFYQWIPGMLLAEKYKLKFPGIKIVIGGLLDKESALDILTICPGFDFAIWGEGEYPLLELCNFLEKGDIDIESVSRLVYRERDNVKATKCQSKYLSFQDYIYPDFSDFIEMPGINSILNLCTFPIEGSRSCHWNRCNFCSLNRGYEYRQRPPESVIREMEYLFKRYKINQYRFVDSDIVGKDIVKFEEFLDMIIESSIKNSVKYVLCAEIIHHGFNSRLIEKLAISGFKQVQIGYEAITDDILKKINKKTDFSDTILFVKFAIKYGILIAGPNIIRGIVGETEDDIVESTRNLVYLRFFLSGKPGKLRHILIQLVYQEGTRFLKMLGIEERKKCKYNPLKYLLPNTLIDDERRFNLLGFARSLKNKIEWENFEKVNKYYEETESTYQILKNRGFYYYSEYLKGELINYILFNEPEYWGVLKAANDEVTSFQNIFHQLKKKFSGLTENHLTEVIEKLKSQYLLYANRDLTRIVSIIDVGDID